MRLKHIRNTDLNLLLGLAILIEERSVSRAAERFNLSQPAMSRVLQRLRETFYDELLIRTKDGYEPTVKARRLFTELQEILPRLDTMLRDDDFDPSTANDCFTIACTDYATVVLGPRLSERLFNEAPKVSLAITAWHDGAFIDCIQGRLDMVLWVNAAPEPLVHEVIFQEDFVCVVSADHTAAGRALTLNDYLHYPHVIVDVLGGQQTLIENKLANSGLRRVVGLRVPYFAAAVNVVPGTNLIATVPRRIANLYATTGQSQVVDAPLELAPFDYIMAWHPRLSDDPAHRWLRQLIAAAGSDALA
jgi:DNA-binding transcriptional LysR family regulator